MMRGSNVFQPRKYATAHVTGSDVDSCYITIVPRAIRLNIHVLTSTITLGDVYPHAQSKHQKHEQ